jgi:hypothetical protein
MQEKEHQAFDLAKAIQPYLSNAKRHHYIPEFLLRRFSTDPGAEHPQIYRLDVKTGDISTPSTLNCAVIQHYNRLSASSGLSAGTAEAVLALVEGQAVLLLEKLIRHETLDAPEREDFSTFLMLQQMRTPRGREWLRFMQDQGAKFGTLKQLYENRDWAKSLLRKELGRNPSKEEMSQFIRQLAEPLENDELIVSGGLDLEILGMFSQAPTIVPLITNMNWTVLKAPAGYSFILSDEPLVLLDARSPEKAVGWGVSSLEVTMPLDPQYCLFLQQEPRQAQRLRVASADLVHDINLRTYARARESIFGPTQPLLESVYAAAQATSYRVERYRPTPPSIFLFERKVGEEHPSNVTRIPGPTEVTIRRSRKDS